MKKVFTIIAGIVMTPAFLFPYESSLLFDQGQFSTPTLNRISIAPWLESIFYYEMPEQERFPKMIKDLGFDAWLAKKAKAEGFVLSPQLNELISNQQKVLEYGFAVDFLSKKIDVTEEDIARYSPSWTSTLPEKWEVLYIFIDDTSAETDQEKEEFKKRALWLKKQLTPDNFRYMARLWSDSPDSAEGGYLGAINPDNMGPTFASQIKKTTVGTIDGPFRTHSGWNIFYIRSYTPLKERDFSREKLHEMTAKKLADTVVQKANQSPEEWAFLIHDLGAKDHPYTKTELTVMENYLLSKDYIRNKAREQKPTEKQLRELYQKKSSIFKRSPSRKAREILLTSKYWSMDKTREAWIARRNVRNKARELRERIINGENFSDLARQYSSSKSASLGGDLDWIQEPSSSLYDITLGDLKINEVSPPIATEKGYLLLQLIDEKRDQPIPFEEVREKCENLWFGRLESELKDKFYEEFLKESKEQ